MLRAYADPAQAREKELRSRELFDRVIGDRDEFEAESGGNSYVFYIDGVSVPRSALVSWETRGWIRCVEVDGGRRWYERC